MEAVSRLSFTPSNFRQLLPDSSVNLIGTVTSGDAAQAPPTGLYMHLVNL